MSAAAELSLAASSGRFAGKLYGVLPKPDAANLVFSPLSIHLALTMTMGGAAATTLEEMRSALCLPEEEEKNYHQSLRSYLEAVRLPMNDLQVAIVNRIYVDKAFQISDEYQANVKKHFLSEIVGADFQHQFEQERQHINQFVTEHTKGLIRDLVPKGTLSAQTRSVLLNAIYFKGIWETQFDKGSTQDHDFHSLEGSQQPVSRVKMMTLRDKQVNGVEDHVIGGVPVSAVRLPYKGGYSMLFVLPPNTAAAWAVVEGFMNEQGVHALATQLVAAQRKRKYRRVSFLDAHCKAVSRLRRPCKSWECRERSLMTLSFLVWRKVAFPM